MEFYNILTLDKLDLSVMMPLMNQLVKLFATNYLKAIYYPWKYLKIVVVTLLSIGWIRLDAMALRLAWKSVNILNGEITIVVLMNVSELSVEKCNKMPKSTNIHIKWLMENNKKLDKFILKNRLIFTMFRVNYY